MGPETSQTFNQKKYWIGVAPKDYIHHWVDEGFCQFNHGKLPPLKRLKPGDWVIYYANKVSLENKTPYQKFIALGCVVEKDIYQVKVSETYLPYRRHVAYVPCQELSIHDIIPDLNFIKNKRNWGAPFRFGFFEISEQDFLTIAHTMKVHI